MSQKNIHEEDCDEEKMWQDIAGEDTLKHLGPISKEEAEYYANL